MMTATLDGAQRRRYKLRNSLQTALLLVGMVALLALPGWILAGVPGLILAVVLGSISLLLTARLSPRLVLRLFSAAPIAHQQAPRVFWLVDALARRAGLPATPTLYYIPSPTMNAFSVGRPGDAAIAITGGMFARLGEREMAGVLAHEISHIAHNDMGIMALADVVSRMTQSMAYVGVFLLIANLPLWLAGQASISWLLIVILMLAPSVGALLQLALSRTREFDADLSAIVLTGDPSGLVRALSKLERYQHGVWEGLPLPGRRAPDPSVLRSHPSTDARVRRLAKLQPVVPELAMPSLPRRPSIDLPWYPVRPRRRRSGLWY